MRSRRARCCCCCCWCSEVVSRRGTIDTGATLTLCVLYCAGACESRLQLVPASALGRPHRPPLDGVGLVLCAAPLLGRLVERCGLRGYLGESRRSLCILPSMKLLGGCRRTLSGARCAAPVIPSSLRFCRVGFGFGFGVDPDSFAGGGDGRFVGRSAAALASSMVASAQPELRVALHPSTALGGASVLRFPLPPPRVREREAWRKPRRRPLAA